MWPTSSLSVTKAFCYSISSITRTLDCFIRVLIIHKSVMSVRGRTSYPFYVFFYQLIIHAQMNIHTYIIQLVALNCCIVVPSILSFVTEKIGFVFLWMGKMREREMVLMMMRKGKKVGYEGICLHVYTQLNLVL